MLKWARTNGCWWDEITCVNAARCGHLEVLQWARKRLPVEQKWTCFKAAWGGHLEVHKWLRDNGCPG